MVMSSCHKSELCDYRWEQDGASITEANALEPLNFKNYLGNTQNIHPKVLYFKNGWNGYKFWMAFTPYPDGDVKKENPSIVVSNDGFNWFEPKGIKNPIVEAPLIGYNSDPHLVYDKDNDIMELWWREYNPASRIASFYRKLSLDGINWGDAEFLITDEKGLCGLSPAVLLKDGIYNVFFSDCTLLLKNEMRIEEGKKIWGEPVEVPIERGPLRVWHQDIIMDDEGNYEIAFVGYVWGCTPSCGDLFYVKATPDFKDISDVRMIIERRVDEQAFDSRAIYRSSLVKVDSVYHVYYSAIDKDWNRHMALSIGDTVTQLKGYR